MKTMKTMMVKAAAVCLCHRALYGAVACAYALGAVHGVGKEAVMAVVAGVYAVMALRG